MTRLDKRGSALFNQLLGMEPPPKPGETKDVLVNGFLFTVTFWEHSHHANLDADAENRLLGGGCTFYEYMIESEGPDLNKYSLTGWIVYYPDSQYTVPRCSLIHALLNSKIRADIDFINSQPYTYESFCFDYGIKTFADASKRIWDYAGACNAFFASCDLDKQTDNLYNALMGMRDR